MRHAAGIAALLAVLCAPPEAAAANQQGCQPPPAQGAELPEDAGPDPIIARLGLPRVHELATGAGVTVGVLDSGVDWRHPKLAGAVAAPGVQVDDSGTISPGQPLDCEPHGTMVAGLIAARPAGDPRVYGVAPGATIYPVRFATPIENLPRQFIASAIRNAVDAGVRVLNLSFAIPTDDQSIRDAIAYAVGKDVVVVAAAGNEGQQDRTAYPAAYDGVLAVAAVAQDGAPTEESNSGDWVDIAAPGVDLTTTAPDSRYYSVDGTSFASALVSGSAALVRQRYPNLSAAQVLERLTTTAVGPRSPRVGAGIVDPYAALTAPGTPASTSASAQPGAVAVVPLPQDNDTISGPALHALIWGGILAAIAVVASVTSVAVRSAAEHRGAKPRQHSSGEPPEVTLT